MDQLVKCNSESNSHLNNLSDELGGIADTAIRIKRIELSPIAFSLLTFSVCREKCTLPIYNNQELNKISHKFYRQSAEQFCGILNAAISSSVMIANVAQKHGEM